MSFPSRPRSALHLLALLGLALPLLAADTPAPSNTTPSDAIVDVPRPYDPGPDAYAGALRTSFHVTMRDGVRIAVDLWLPEGLEEGATLPAILHQTRYWRGAQLRWPASLLFDSPGDRAEAFVRQGYAWLSVDARGSGASFGTRPYPWSPDETRDGAQLVDWIIAQPWSNGTVGAFGTSYDGTTAEFLAVNQHPAVRAVAPRFSLFDAWADIAFPGGLRLASFARQWGTFNAALDRNEVPPHLAEMLGWRRLLVLGVRPVDGADGDTLLQDALKEHADNWDVTELAMNTTYRDDGTGTNTAADFSPFSFTKQLDGSGTPIYGWSGWFDGAYAHSAIKRHLTLTNPENRLILGPWDHGARFQVRGAVGEATEFDHRGELLKFFDRYLKQEQTGLVSDAPVHYYTMVEGRWKAASAWPPPSDPLRLYFGADGTLSPEAPQQRFAADRYSVDPEHRTGTQSRWDSLMGYDVAYADRAAADATLLTYDSPTLDRDVEVTGHPVVTLYVASSANDGAFLAYLEDVAPDGSVTYVTEGVLRALHRKLATTPAPYRQVVPYRTLRRADGRPLRPGEVAELVFDLLPTSYLFRAGHSIRIALAGADADHFSPVPDGAPPTWEVSRSRAHPSHVMLPVAPNQAGGR